MEEIFKDGVIDRTALVKVQNTNIRWDGKIGFVLRWLHDDWYIVKVEGRELVLDLSRGEFTRTNKEE
jgi:hypothetical protein